MKNELAKTTIAAVAGAIAGAITTYAVGFLPQKQMVFVLKQENTNLQVEAQALNEDKVKAENELKQVKGQLEENKQEQKDFINNISLVVDSIKVGGSYQGIANNGEILLSTNALKDYIGKAVSWDASNNTVFIGEKTDKIAKEFNLWNRPYIEMGDTESLISDLDESSIGFRIHSNDTPYNNYITYALDGKAQNISGILSIDTDDSPDQVRYTIFNENDELLYSSPILTKMAPSTNFSVDVSACLKVKIVVDIDTPAIAHFITSEISNLKMLTTDY